MVFSTFITTFVIKLKLLKQKEIYSANCSLKLKTIKTISFLNFAFFTRFFPKIERLIFTFHCSDWEVLNYGPQTMLANLFQLSDSTITKLCKIIFSNFISLEKCLHQKGLLLPPRRGPWWLILVLVFGKRAMKARHSCNQNEGPCLMDHQLVDGGSPYTQRKLILLCKCK